MKKSSTAKPLAAAFVCSFSFIAFRTDLVSAADVDPRASEVSGPNRSKSVPLWRRGISTWTGDGYIKLPQTIEMDAPPATVTPKTTSVPYTVPVDPSARKPSADTDRIVGDGLSLPGIKVNPLATAAEMKLVTSGRESDATKLAEPIGTSPEPSAALTLPMNTRATAELNPPTVSDASEGGVSGGGSMVDASAGSAASTSPPEIIDTSSNASPTIANKIESGVGLSEPPLHEETVRWYQYPWRWMRTGWTNHGEIGLDGSDGNSDTLAIQTGLELKRATDNDTFALDFDYRFVTSQDMTTEDNGRLNLDYDRLFVDSQWSWFGKYGMEWDKFKAFDLRLNLNGGAGYHWIRNDRTTFVSRFGAGASKEIGAPDDGWTPEAVLGFDGEHRINRYHKVKGKFDYFPAWDDFSDYRLVADLGWEILLDDDENLSLKLAATDRYDSTPQGAEPNDLYYSLLLLFKF